MELDSFHRILVPLAAVFSQPSFQNFVLLMKGWILAGVRAMTSTALEAYGQFPKHFATYYRFFSRAAWNPDRLGDALLHMVLPFAPEGPLVAAVDDTIARKSGKHIWGANVHHDPLGFVPNALCFGHNWVVLAVIIRVPLLERPVAVPIYWRLYRSKKGRKGKSRNGREKKTTGATSARDHRTRPELAVEMVHRLRQAVPAERLIELVGDSAYGGKSITRHLPEGVVALSRLPMNGALYALPPDRPSGCNGRPRVKGKRLPSPEQMAKNPQDWRTATVRLYGKNVRVLYKTLVALWYNSAGKLPLRIVVVRDPKGRRKDEAFFTTDVNVLPESVLETYALRWAIEVAFRDSKQTLGFERSQARTAHAVKRTGPFAFVSYTLTVAWFCQHGYRLYPEGIPIMPWYRQKRTPSFANMLQLLRNLLSQQKFCNTPQNIVVLKNLQDSRNHASKRAA
jgi:SRSO17 transposase